MKTATVRDLRNNFAKLEAWLAEGEQIQIQKRGQPVAVLSASRPKSRKVKLPDFAARRREVWGDRVFTAAEVAQMRADEHEHEGV